jgi:hypothetical protein
MMKQTVLLFLFFISGVALSSEKTDSTRTKLNASCTVSLNSNGISSIPAFSLGDPAIIAAVGLAKGRLSFDPVLAYDLEMKPWFFDSWVHYVIVDRPVFKLRTGINFSMYFSDLKLPDDEIVLQGQRYWAFELAGIFNFNPKTSLTVLVWNDRGQDPGTITGLYTSVAIERSEIPVGKRVLIAGSLQIFNIAYDGNNDGLFVSPRIAASGKKVAVSVFFQVIQPVTTNISPNPGFQWNLGASYSF